MKPENGITRRGIEISTRITTCCKMPTAMHANHSIRKITLHLILECENLGIAGSGEELIGIVRGCAFRVLDADSAAEASRIEAETVGLWI